MVRRVLGFVVLIVCGDSAIRILYDTFTSRETRISPIPALVTLSCLLYVGWRWFCGEVVGGDASRNREGHRPEGRLVDPTDPLWLKSVAKARETLPDLRELFHAGNSDCAVKFPFHTDADTTEHIWGQISAFGDKLLKTTIETPPLGHRGPLPNELEVELDHVEDWLVTCPDGTVRGGYTTLAEIVICEREGFPLPRHVRDLKPRLVEAAQFMSE